MHWSGYVLLVLYLGSQVGYAYFGTPPNIPRSQRILFMVVPFFILPFVSRFPIGLLIYWMTTNLWTVGQGIITRRMVPKPAPARSARRGRRRRRSRRPSNGDGAGPAEVHCFRLRAVPVDNPGPAAPREAEEEAGRPPVSEPLTVEATGETVGEAKWQALRELERWRPGSTRRPSASRWSPRASADCSASATRLPGWWRSVDAPAGLRPRLSPAVRRRTRASSPPTCASCSRGSPTASTSDCRVEIVEDEEAVTGSLAGDDLGPADRPPRPDDRRDPVPGERDRLPHVRRRPQGRGRGRRGLPRAPP